MTPSELITLRQELGLSQAQLSRMLAVHRHTIANWEQGKTRIPHTATIVLNAMRRFGVRGETRHA